MEVSRPQTYVVQETKVRHEIFNIYYISQMNDKSWTVKHHEEKRKQTPHEDEDLRRR